MVPKVPIIIDMAEKSPASAVTDIDIGIPSLRISRMIVNLNAEAFSKIFSFLYLGFIKI